MFRSADSSRTEHALCSRRHSQSWTWAAAQRVKPEAPPPKELKPARRAPVSNARRSRDRRWKQLSSVRTLTSGSGGGCAPSPGSSGSVDRLALPSCDASASAGTWRHRPPAARMALAAREQPRAHHRIANPPSQFTRPGSRRGSKACMIHRTAGYGPVRPVVWEGRSREASPYPHWPLARALALSFLIQGLRLEAPGFLR